ncbi:hypothetical protein [Salinibacillus xinjiangensis]|nr:hypothetical protein [Salinibacillus xinjiangensis]
MNRELVKRQIKNCSIDELVSWRKHAVKCLDYYVKYTNEFEVDECNFVIFHIDQQLSELNAREAYL